jgi:hypothetical protein
MIRDWSDELCGPAFQVDTARAFDRWLQPTVPGLHPRVAPTVELQRELVQGLLDAAGLLRQVHGAKLATSRLAVIAVLPDMWDNQICAFHSEEYFRTFALRDSPTYKWTPLPNESLTRRLGLSAPPGFDERGFLTLVIDQNTVVDGRPYREEGEVWLLAES